MSDRNSGCESCYWYSIGWNSEYTNEWCNAKKSNGMQFDPLEGEHEELVELEPRIDNEEGLCKSYKRKPRSPNGRGLWSWLVRHCLSGKGYGYTHARGKEQS